MTNHVHLLITPEHQDSLSRLFQSSFDARVLDEVRICLQSGTPLGNDRFKTQIEQALKVKVGQSKRGRPRKKVL